jgi:outer membrane receptor protein involved in Fe transport
MLAYGLFSQGFSLGGVNTAPDVADSLRFLKPETVDNYEIGVRSSWLENRLSVNAAIFYIDWKDIHVDSLTDSFYPITVNSGKAKTNGVELDIRAALNDNLDLIVGYSSTNGELTSDGIAGDDGDRLSGYPEKQLTAGLLYNRELNNKLGLHASYRLSSQSDVLTRMDEAAETLPGFTVHYASVGLAGEKWQATLYADNLFNKYAVTGVRDEPSRIGTDPSSNEFVIRRYFQNVLTPRTIGLDLRYRFK